MNLELSQHAALGLQVQSDDPMPDAPPLADGRQEVSPAAMRWQPIDTMPDRMRDGRQVLLWSDTGASVCTFHGWGWAVILDGAIVDRLNSRWPLFWCEISQPHPVSALHR